MRYRLRLYASIIPQALLCANLFIAHDVLSFRQSASARQQPNVRALRNLFLKTFDQDFELLSNELVRGDISRGLYWLVRVRPRRSGFFVVRYINRQPLKGSALPYKEHEMHIKVGERACRRNLTRYRQYANLCLGDTVILPINLNDYPNPTFSRTSSDQEQALSEANASEAKEPQEISLPASAAQRNPVDAYLKYLGRTVVFSPHRDLNNITVGGTALFEARAPGSFNLRLSPRAPASLEPYMKTERVEWRFSIIIVPDGAPVNLIAPYERIVEYDRDRSPRVYNSQLYQVSVQLLQPGERIGLGFFSQQGRRSTEEWKQIEPLFKDVEPVIEELPFSLKSDENYNDWFMKYAVTDKSP